MVQFYSVKLKKKIEIPANDIKQVVRKNTVFLVGAYKVNGKTYKAWKIVGRKK